MEGIFNFDPITCITLLIYIWHIGICNNYVHALCGPTDSNEVQAFREAVSDLNHPKSNCRDDPCAKSPSCWSSDDETRLFYVNQVACLCDNGNNHVTNVSFKGQDLTGVLPKSLSKLPYLQIIDLSRNLLHGSIPPEWTSMENLTFLSTMANQLSGPIPGYLGSITSLKYISFESNRFSGAVPAELGHLVNLQTLVLNDNDLTGQLPEEMKMLSNLVELRLGSNSFQGRLPDYFVSWMKLKKLEIEGSGFEGPVPPSVTLLDNVSELRISDLSGEGFEFPSLQNMTNLNYLVLRNCNMSGSIPGYLASKLPLKMIDLSFNKLGGPIPSELHDFSQAQDMYLMHNMLTGAVPDWMVTNIGRSLSNIDLSYNLLDEISGNCDSYNNINFFRSFKGDTKLESSHCLKNVPPCSKALYSLHINCGGEKITVGKTTYEQDETPGGASKFFSVGLWGFSSSGEYWFARDISDYITKSSTPLPKGSDLYLDARISATSLTYYGRCLARGSYKVTLQFYEIIFAANKSFSSLGRRKFDIFIQEKLVHKDFDILIESNGTDKPVNKIFPNIPVNSSIEIRLFYAGKGSTAIPARESGAYGPLISAISVESEFRPPLSRVMIIWICIGGVSLLLFLIASVLAVFWWRSRREDMTSREDVLSGFDLQTGSFTYKQIKAATNNFDSACKIGEGGFGSVYLGTLLDGSNIAVKKLLSKTSQGNREFINELGMISGLHYPNLVRLYGCCVEGNQLFLIYEYMENNNLARPLFGSDDCQLILDWPTRRRICTDVARGLTFLHEESAIKIVHRDIKVTNILLDKDFNAKISDFGLARLNEDDHTHVSTRVAGTIGYMAPEYALWGYLTFKADVYSFGVVLLEIVAGCSNTKFRPEQNHICLVNRAFVLQQKGNLKELVDQRLGMEYSEEEVLRTINIALLCTNSSPELRPIMSEALAMLDGSMAVHESTVDPNMQWMQHHVSKQQHDLMSENDTQSLIVSACAPSYESSSSHHDLYPIDLHFDN